MEMLVVVAIIAITAAIAAPAIGSQMAERRVNEAAYGLVRQGARARSEAMAYGRAHLLRYSQSSFGVGGANGSVQLWRGRLSGCSTNDWPSIINGPCESDRDCVDDLNMGNYSFSSQHTEMRVPGATSVDLCFQPDGDMLASIDGGAFAAVPPSGSDAISFRLRRISNGTPAGVERWVAFPFGGAPRLMQ